MLTAEQIEEIGDVIAPNLDRIRAVNHPLAHESDLVGEMLKSQLRCEALLSRLVDAAEKPKRRTRTRAQD